MKYKQFLKNHANDYHSFARIYREGIAIMYNETYKGKDVQFEYFYPCEILFLGHEYGPGKEYSYVDCSNAIKWFHLDSLTILQIGTLAKIIVSANTTSEKEKNMGLSHHHIDMHFTNGNPDKPIRVEFLQLSYCSGPCKIVGEGTFTGLYQQTELPSKYEGHPDCILE